MSIKQINDTTYTADGLGDVKPSVLIGGKATDKFIPNVNASFYDDEFFINLNRKGKPAVSGKSSSAEIVGDDKDIFHIDDQGRLKWDIEFGECPKSLTLSWEIKCSDAIEFYYQGPLTEEEIKDGCVRPDEIVGSYAVYCNKANNKYKTGKLCHIPRPFVIDANGSREWCDMLITDGVLTITLPELFMQSAVYPVRLDPTIGYTTAGGSGFAATDRLLACGYTAPSSGAANPGTIYINVRSKTSDNIRGAVYTDNSGTVASASKLSSSEAEITISGTLPAWQSGAITLAGITASTIYYLAVHSDSCAIAYDSGTATYYYGVGYTPGVNGLPSTFSSGPSSLARILSVYLEYTESGGATGNSYYYQQQQM